MGILRTDRVTGLGGANAIKGSVEMRGAQNLRAEVINSNADFNLGSSDYTVECWLYRGGTTGTAASLDQDLVMLWNNTNNRRSWGLYYDASGNLGLIGSSDGSNSDMGSYHSYTFPDNNAWYHIAAVRISNTVTIYVNGAVLGSATVSGSYYENTVDNLVIGGQLSGTNYDSKIVRGFLSNVRIIIGDGIYTGAFTPPTNELTVTANTKLLCCQSPGNVLQEATGKTLVAYRSSSNNSFPLASHFTPNSPVGFSTTTDVGTQFGTTFNGVTTFDSQAYMVPPGGNTRERNRGRAVFTGGYNAPQTGTTEMEFFNIQSGGLTEEFGNQSVNRRFAAGLASPTRGVTGGSNGTPSWVTGTMEFVTIADTSNTTTFGNMTAAGGMVSACSSSTRGIFFSVWDASGSGPAHKGHIDFITIATTGNSADFGQLSVSRPEAAGFGSPTRGICAGGYPASDGTTMSNVIDFITIASTGNASDFGDLTQARQAVSGASSQTRGVVAGGYVYGSPAGTFNINTIDFITIASTGNATDFGDLIVGAMAKSVGNCSDLTRGVFAGGKTSAPTYINTIEFVTIASTGNASDFGDLKRTRAYGSAFSDSHGGLS